MDDYPDFLARLNVPPPDTDATVMGLERKLEVLRAQLSACQAGEEVGPAGIAAWSGLQSQADRIAGLEADLAGLRHHVAIVEEQRGHALAIADLARQDCERAARDLAAMTEARDSAYRDWQRATGELAAAIGERDAARQSLEAARTTGSQAEMALAETRSALASVLGSTSWRLTWPLRAAVDRVRAVGS